MKHLQNLHTHTTYCDGADTPEAMVLAAIDKGFESIGFSEHSYMSYSASFFKNGDKTEEYKEVVRSLKEKYKDRIRIYLGLEVDMFSAPDMSGYDYLIGSAHYLSINGEYVGFDRSAEYVKSVIDNHFDGNGMEYAKAYYKTLSELPKYGKFDIIGHFDLIIKHSDNIKLFDEDAKEYRNAALEAAHALKGKIPFFEVNTGAIARGYRKAPYPSMYILNELKNLGFGAVISSDCHNKAMLDCNFNEAAEMLRESGFKEKYILTDNGFSAVAL